MFAFDPDVRNPYPTIGIASQYRFGGNRDLCLRIPAQQCLEVLDLLIELAVGPLPRSGLLG